MCDVETHLVEDVDIVCKRIASGVNSAIIRLQDRIVEATKIRSRRIETVRHG